MHEQRLLFDMYGLETLKKLNQDSVDPAVNLRRDWARVGTVERGRTSSCGICGCRSNRWVTVGSTMIGIKTILACPGNKRFQDLHQKISDKQKILHDDVLPASVQEEVVLELLRLRAVIARAGPDVEPKVGRDNH